MIHLETIQSFRCRDPFISFCIPEDELPYHMQNETRRIRRNTIMHLSSGVGQVWFTKRGHRKFKIWKSQISSLRLSVDQTGVEFYFSKKSWEILQSIINLLHGCQFNSKLFNFTNLAIIFLGKFQLSPFS